MHITVTVTLAFIILLNFFSLLSQVALRFSHFFSLFSLLLFPSLFSFWLQPSPISRLRLGAPRHSLGSPSLRLRASPSSSPAPLASSEPSSPWPWSEKATGFWVSITSMGLFADRGGWWRWLGVRIKWVSAWMGLFADQGEWWWWLGVEWSSDDNDDGWVCSPIGGVMMVVGSERERERESQWEREAMSEKIKNKKNKK